MNIFRIQNDDGFGPYAGSRSLDPKSWQETVHSFQQNTPGPAADPGMAWWVAMDPQDREEWQFGFESLDKLNAWYTPTEIGKLRRLGYLIVRLDAKEIKSSRYQSVYRGLVTLKEGNINHEKRMGENSNQLQLW